MKKTPLDMIQESNYKKLWDRLQALSYPCTIVVYGAECTSRTTYRGEHDSRFGISYCQNAEEAWNVVDCGWAGWPPDLEVYVIPGDGEPRQV